MFYVTYFDRLLGYGLRRNFDTREAAQEFIHVNALVCALPRVALWEVKKTSKGLFIVTKDDVTAAVVDTLSEALHVIHS